MRQRRLPRFRRPTRVAVVKGKVFVVVIVVFLFDYECSSSGGGGKRRWSKAKNKIYI